MKDYDFRREPEKVSRDKSSGPMQRLMKEYSVQSKGKTLSGHFSPDEAIDVLQTARTRCRSVSEILTVAVRLGLPALKKQFPPTRSNG